MEYETLVAPGAALLVGVVAALATMFINRERYSQKIERLSNALKNVEDFPKLQEGLAKDMALARLRMGYSSRYPILVFVVQASNFAFFVSLSVMVYSLYTSDTNGIVGALVLLAIYFSAVFLDYFYFKDYLKHHA